MKKNIISVIVPVYNTKDYLQRCFDSLKNQTIFDKLELIFIDDGSSDGSSELLDSFLINNVNVNVRHIENNGVSNARNLGIEIAKGNFIAFVDADDWIDNDYFEMLYNAAIKTNADIVCSSFIAEYEDGKQVYNNLIKEEINLTHTCAIKAFLKGNSMDVNITDKLFTKEIIGEKRFEKNIKISEDRLFLFQCLMETSSVYVLPHCKYHYFMNHNSAMQKDFSQNRLDDLIVMNKIIKIIQEKEPHLLIYAECMEIDVKCRLYGDMYLYKVSEIYAEKYKSLKKDIYVFSLLKKLKYSTKKHFLALVAAKISPRIYNFLRNDMKLKYK